MRQLGQTGRGGDHLVLGQAAAQLHQDPAALLPGQHRGEVERAGQQPQPFLVAEAGDGGVELLFLQRHPVNLPGGAVTGELGPGRPTGLDPVFGQGLFDLQRLAVQLQLQLHAVVEHRFGLAVFADRLQLKVGPSGRILAEQDPVQRVGQRRLACAVVAVDGGVAAAGIEAVGAERFEMAAGQPVQFHLCGLHGHPPYGLKNTKTVLHIVRLGVIK